MLPPLQLSQPRPLKYFAIDVVLERAEAPTLDNLVCKHSFVLLVSCCWALLLGNVVTGLGARSTLRLAIFGKTFKASGAMAV